ncbi:MAG TPA: YfiR family protein [Burkholderiaceae bacterium]|nr:YfiR family protein [Burkholderiaceae bacterium]
MNRLAISGPGPRPSPRAIRPSASRIVPSTRRWALALPLALVLFGLGSPSPLAQDREPDAPTDAQIKAAYIHRFLGFVEWPASQLPSAATPLLVGVAGADAVQLELERFVQGRPVQGRPVEVQRIAPDTPPRRQLHVVFVGDERGAARRVLDGYRDLPVLTVADGPWGAEAGAVLSFVPQDGRVRFQASLPAAERAGLRLSARLLGVAVRVTGAP